MNEFSVIEVWENHEAKFWYDDSINDIINQISNPYLKITNEEIKADFYKKIKKVV